MNILFDLDGTLADPFEAIYNSLEFALVTNGESSPSKEIVRTCIGPPLQISLVEIFKLSSEKARQVMQDYRQHHAAHCVEQYSIYSGTQEALQELQKKFKLYVATSKPHVFAKPILERFKLRSLFKEVYGSELDGVNSQKTDLIRHLLQEEKIDPKQSFMIGDRKHDAIGAKNNQVQALGVLWGYGSKEELAKAETLEQFSSWSELLDFFKRLS